MLENRINRDKKRHGVIIQMRKQTVTFDLAVLINDGVITFADIDEFSRELKEAVKFLCGNKNDID